MNQRLERIARTLDAAMYETVSIRYRELPVGADAWKTRSTRARYRKARVESWHLSSLGGYVGGVMYRRPWEGPALRSDAAPDPPREGNPLTELGGEPTYPEYLWAIDVAEARMYDRPRQTIQNDPGAVGFTAGTTPAAGIACVETIFTIRTETGEIPAWTKTQVPPEEPENPFVQPPIQPPKTAFQAYWKFWTSFAATSEEELNRLAAAVQGSFPAGETRQVNRRRFDAVGWAVDIERYTWAAHTIMVS